MDTSSSPKVDARVAGASHQRVEHIACAVGIGEELPIRFFVKRNPEITKQIDRPVRRKCAEHLAHDRALAPPEIRFVDDGVGDVTPGAAADEDFRSRFSGPFQEHDPPGRVRPPRKDRSCETSRAGTHDHDRVRHSLITLIIAAYTAVVSLFFVLQQA